MCLAGLYRERCISAFDKETAKIIVHDTHIRNVEHLPAGIGNIECLQYRISGKRQAKIEIIRRYGDICLRDFNKDCRHTPIRTHEQGGGIR